jgi:hypothetical protein
MDTSKANPELFAALAQAQGEIENAAKSSNNPHFKSKYADLAEVLNTVRPVLSKHGLCLLQGTSFDGSLVSVTTVLAHASGGCVSSTASCVPAKSDGQGVGAATTYLRRYSAAGICGVAQEDDDGNSAAHSAPPAPVKRKVIEPIREDQLAKILDLFSQTGKQGVVLAHYGVKMPHELSDEQANEVIRRLSIAKVGGDE